MSQPNKQGARSQESEVRREPAPGAITSSKALVTGKHPAGNKDVEWRHYPQFEKLFQPDQFEPTLRKMEKTLRQLEDLSKNGPESDRERARLAAAAYIRTFALIREIVDKRNEMSAQAATSTPASR